MGKQEYLHGFDPVEQARLIHQAKFLESYVYSGIDFHSTHRLLEVGCGVGAQTKILLKKFPHLKIDGVDLSRDQLQVAERRLKKEIHNHQVSLFQQDAQKLKLNFKKYDGAFLCWFLEHVPEPVKVLRGIKNYLRPGGLITCTEVFNQSLFMEPYSPEYLNYWFQFNDYQWSIQGHPFVGAKLGNLLKMAGYVDIHLETRPLHFDSRMQKLKKNFIEYFFNILLSAEKTLLEKKRITPSQVRRMKKEVERVKGTKDSVFYYAFIRATARKP